MYYKKETTEQHNHSHKTNKQTNYSVGASAVQFRVFRTCSTQHTAAYLHLDTCCVFILLFATVKHSAIQWIQRTCSEHSFIIPLDPSRFTATSNRSAMPRPNFNWAFLLIFYWFYQLSLQSQIFTISKCALFRHILQTSSTSALTFKLLIFHDNNFPRISF